MVRRLTLAFSLLVFALAAAPVAAPAHPGGGPDDGRWDDWRPSHDDSSYADETEADDGAWFDDVQDSGDALPPPDAPAPDPDPQPAPASSGLNGVPYRTLILRYARQRGLDPAFVAAIVRAESSFNPRARSRVGARGLMQLMPATARGMGAPVAKLYDPETSIRFGTLYLTHVRAVVGRSTRLIAAGYNAGPGAVKSAGGVPPYAETQAYVRRVAAFHAAYRTR